jgi:hypothetical protein
MAPTLPCALTHPVEPGGPTGASPGPAPGGRRGRKGTCDVNWYGRGCASTCGVPPRPGTAAYICGWVSAGHTQAVEGMWHMAVACGWRWN